MAGKDNVAASSYSVDFELDALYSTDVILRIYETASESAWYNFFGFNLILALTANKLTIVLINYTLSFSSFISSEISDCGSYFCASQ